MVTLNLSQRRHESKVTLVTGAAQGLGRAVARRFASEGALIVLADRTAELCEAALDEILNMGAQAIAVGADLETSEGSEAAVRAALSEFGRLDISVHNVGGAIRFKPFWEYSVEEVEAEVARSLWPSVWGCYSASRVMVKQGFGSIVNIGSNATRSSLRVPYSSSKGGVHALTISLARDLAGGSSSFPIRVNCVSPGALIANDRISLRNPNPLDEREHVWKKEAYAESVADGLIGRPGLVEEVTGAVSFLASEEASYITGQILYVAGASIGTV